MKDLADHQKTNSSKESRSSLSEALHMGSLGKLRRVLPKVLISKKRVAILMDNLDKAWDKQEAIEDLSDFLLSLLNASERILTDLRQDLKISHTDVSLTIFLRSDIFNKIHQMALEPDKIRYSRLSWRDGDELLRVVEERFIASHDNSVSADEMWEKYFCEEVKSIPTAQYLTQRILPRPRDLVLFVGQAVREAINHQHVKVEKKDILAAEKECSQNAFRSLLVESGTIASELGSILYEFSGANNILTQNEVEDLIKQTINLSKPVEDILKVLIEINFLGVEIEEADFRFPEDPQEMHKNKVQARNLSRRRTAPPRYRIHPAFWAFLEICES